ncbi:MAG: hypothetical protein OEY59_10405 [Deltaproteobacteria bacterium]|nr:hypothetical protein [Deltaproteobacteria bacterium]
MSIFHYEHPEDKNQSMDIDPNEIASLTGVYEFKYGKGFGFAVTFLGEQGKKTPLLFKTVEEADQKRLELIELLPD